ncbi:MAG: cytochrome P450 [Xenococcaceae cyanobacterium MO_188.B32]|nr:cytochrome P450 [Xenococcaceae cyanobacterium MO_188.B32]
MKTKLPDVVNIPPFLQTIQWISRPLEFLDACARNYGDIFTVRWNNFPQVFISNPEDLQELFAINPKFFGSIPGNGPSGALLGENSAIWSEYEQHQRQRKTFMSIFHGEYISSAVGLITDITKQVTSNWIPGKPFSVRLSMQEISLQIILRTVLGLEQGEKLEQFKQLYTSLLDYVTGSPLVSSLLFFNFLQSDLGSWSPWGRFLRQKSHIDRLIYSEIQQRREDFKLIGTDVLSLLLSVSMEADRQFSDIELRDEVMTLLFAGHESSASALAWALYWIHSLPEVRDRLLEEIKALGSNPNPMDIVQLPYLTSVCRETLRIYPPGLVAIARIAKAPIQLRNYVFETGTVLVPCIYLTHQRQELYPEPKRFRPERFLERKFSPFEYLPFGGGHRRCIGMSFAQFEMKLVLATILLNFRLSMVSNRSFKPLRRGAAMAPPVNMKMIASPV